VCSSKYEDSRAVLGNPSEAKTEARLRYLNQAHALFQLNPTNKGLRDTVVGIYAEMMTSNEFTHVYITEGDERLPLPWYIAFCAGKCNTPPPIFTGCWPERWPSEASFALIERREDVYYIKREVKVPYREILTLEVFSFPKL
jgi:hypothetical protein